MQGKIETRVGLFVLIALAIFIYMGFQIGSFRFDWSRYATYTLECTDVNGLVLQADVKIAGVKVGWVEQINLVSNTKPHADLSVMILRKYKLYQNAYGVVRQQSILGNKYLEVVPGDAGQPPLQSGAAFKRETVEPTSIDDLLKEFKVVAQNVKEVTDTFKQVVGSSEGKDQFKQTCDALHTTIDRLAAFSTTLQDTLVRNQENVDSFLSLGADVRQLAQKLDDHVLPSFKESIERISDVFDRDFNRIATKLESTAASLEKTSCDAQEGVKSACCIAEKINGGTGTIGCLINDEQPYNDLKFAARGVRDYFEKAARLQVVFDSHFESMHRPAENYDHTDSKGYFDVRFHPNEDHFYQVQLASSEKGIKTRHDVYKQYTDNDGTVVEPACLTGLTDKDYLQYIYNERIEVFRRNTLSWGLQFGKVFSDVALRFGIFDGTAGVAMDIDIPLRSDNFRWLTSVEAFDFSGWNRRDDRRPHLKWLNKMYLLNSVYLTFGADDFASKKNANMFFGLGLRFGDDDIKMLTSGIAGASSLPSGGNGIGIKTGTSTVVY